MPENFNIDPRELFAPLDQLLIGLLKSLSPDEWEAQTVASKWKVKDVAAHLLDGNIRALSLQRDQYFGSPGPTAFDFQSMVSWLNQFNHDFVHAAKRMSPNVMIMLHEVTGPPTSEYFASLAPNEKSIFPVDWAGEKESINQFHVAREYTEKFLHQQQIRDAVNKQAILTKEFFHPFISTLITALPHTYRQTDAPEGTTLVLSITGDAGGSWEMKKQEEGWKLSDSPSKTTADASVTMDPDTAWKLFSKSWRAKDVEGKVRIEGDQKLGAVVLEMVAVMA